MAACSAGKGDVARLLMEKGAKINACNEAGRTPLIWAAIGKMQEGSAPGGSKLPHILSADLNNGREQRVEQAEIVKLLLEADADVNIRDVGGSTALMEAAARGFREVVTLLLRRGADVDTINHEGLTATDLAQAHGWVDVANLLRNYVSLTGP